jgi:hypothetical protein
MDQVGLVAPSFERDKEPSVSMQDGGMSWPNLSTTEVL